MPSTHTYRVHQQYDAWVSLCSSTNVGCGKPQPADGQKVDTHVFSLCSSKTLMVKAELGCHRTSNMNMVQLIEDNYYIEHSDFEELINRGGWILTKKMKENWDENRHYEYLLGLYNSNANLSVEYVIDSSSLKYANKIDICIISKTKDSENQSSPKYIQYIKL